MNIQLDTPSTDYFFRHYQPGLIKTNQDEYSSSIIITPHQIIAPSWEPQSFQEISNDAFNLILDLEAEVVLFGTGEKQHIPENDLFQLFFKKGKSLDFMSSDAACRTFNILAEEGRSVVAAILVK